jgi:hypothetical protein
MWDPSETLRKVNLLSEFRYHLPIIVALLYRCFLVIEAMKMRAITQLGFESQWFTGEERHQLYPSGYMQK